MKHYCQCGCGQEVEIYKHNNKYGLKGQPRKYICGHNAKHTKGSSFTETKLATGQEIHRKINGLSFKHGDEIDVDIFWGKDKTNSFVQTTKRAKIIKEYDKFYLVDMGNYKSTQLKIDLALRG